MFENFVLNETIFLSLETKNDESFPNSEVFAKGFKMFRKHKSKKSGCFYIRRK